MDKSWMKKRRGDMEYIQGVLRFVEFASLHACDGKILCPCTKCVNLNLVPPGVACEHLWSLEVTHIGNFMRNERLHQRPPNVGVVMCRTPMNNIVTSVGYFMICAPHMK